MIALLATGRVSNSCVGSKLSSIARDGSGQQTCAGFRHSHPSPSTQDQEPQDQRLKDHKRSCVSTGVPLFWLMVEAGQTCCYGPSRATRSAKNQNHIVHVRALRCVLPRCRRDVAARFVPPRQSIFTFPVFAKNPRRQEPAQLAGSRRRQRRHLDACDGALLNSSGFRCPGAAPRLSNARLVTDERDVPAPLRCLPSSLMMMFVGARWRQPRSVTLRALTKNAASVSAV